MRRGRRRPGALVALAALTVGACSGGGGHSQASGTATSRVIPIKPANYTFPAWLPDDLIAFEYLPANASLPEGKIMLVRPDGTGLTELSLPRTRPGCEEFIYDRPTVMWDGQLALGRQCNIEKETVVLADDVKTGAIVELTPSLGNLGPANHSWAPDASRGFVTQSSQICASFAAADKNGLHPLAITLGTGSKKWRLDSEFSREIGEEKCTKDGRADFPAVSPDGKQVAFLASPDSVGVSDTDRLEEPWQIWIMGADGANPHRLFGDLGEASSLAWSPDGRWLAFNDRKSPHKGIWLYEVTTKVLRHVTDEDGSTVSWARDGRRLVSLRTISEETDEEPLGTNALVIWDVSPLLGR